MAWPQQTNGLLTSAGLSVSTPWASGSKRRVDHAGGLEGKELLVADGSCPHIRELLATCSVPVLWLTGQQDPLIVVGRALAQRRAEGTPVQTLHWVSHGAPGAVFVGPKKINTTALLNAQQELAAWQLKTFNLWSCSTGADQDFVSVLEELSGASVWASPGILGRQADGSSHWQLTKPSKNKRPDLPINKSQKLAWNYSLVAGADFEGPQSLSGTVATGRAWYSLEETISSGERLLLNQDFFGSVFAAMGDGDTVHIGVKSSTWASSDNPFTADSAAGFAGNFAIRLTTERSGQWAGTKRSSIYKDGAEVASSYGSSRGTTWSPQYFLELSHDGDNVRIAQSRSSSSERALHISTTPYSWWDVDGITTNKDQTGDQNFNFTSTDILLHWSGWDANSTFDYATVDWSELTETAVPTDETAPIFSSAATSTDGTKVVLTYNEALSVTTPYGDSAVTWSRFTVTTDGDANAVTGVSVSGATVELTLTNTVKNDQTVTVAYTDSTNDNDYIAIQDLGGCDAASLSSTAAINNSSIAGTPPTIAISSDVASLKAGETASLSFALSEASSNFAESDVTFSGGALSNWNAASATSYSATFTPTADSTTNAVVSVASSKFSDAAGNTNNDGSDDNNTVTLSVDTVRPTIAVSSDVASLKAGETASLSFALSEASSNFAESDVTFSGGALSNWNAASATSYSSTFTPTADSTTNAVVSVASSKFSDAAGNTNNDGSDSNNSVSLSVDTVRPTFSSAATSTDGAKVVLSYDKALSSTTAPASAFAVTTDGAANAVTAVTNDGATSELTLTNTIKSNQAVTVAYNDPSSSDDANAVQDSAGNDAVSFSSTTVTNNSTIPASSGGGSESSDGNSSSTLPSDLIPNTPTTSKLLLSNENTFSVTKSASKGLWINLKVISADSDLQNSLIIVDQHNNTLGCIGATPFSGNCGEHGIFIPHGSSISFHQFSNNQPLISSPQLDITDNSDGSFQLRLNDRLTDSDHDDLIIDISYSASSPNPAATSMAAKQQGIHNVVLDLSSIPATGQTLKLSLNSNCAFNNRIAMVKLSEDADGNFSIDGITNTAGAAFDQAVADNLINPGGNNISCTGVDTQAIEWNLSASDAGFYAPVLINPDGEIYTYGSSQIKTLGCNFFAFEDNNSQNSSDWDFNDLSIQFEII